MSFCAVSWPDVKITWHIIGCYVRTDQNWHIIATKYTDKSAVILNYVLAALDWQGHVPRGGAALILYAVNV